MSGILLELGIQRWNYATVSAGAIERAFLECQAAGDVEAVATLREEAWRLAHARAAAGRVIALACEARKQGGRRLVAVR